MAEESKTAPGFVDGKFNRLAKHIEARPEEKAQPAKQVKQQDKKPEKKDAS